MDRYFNMLEFHIGFNCTRVSAKLDILLEEIKKIMATLQDVDAAIAAENAQLQSLATLAAKLVSDVDALVKALKNGVDYTNELNAIQGNAALLQTAVGNVQSADTEAAGAESPPASGG